MKLSVIIPTYNEADNIGKLLNFFSKKENQHLEIIVSDGGSTDDTKKIAESFNVKFLQSPQKGRAKQLNYGASFAKGDIFYFVHADTLPPENYFEDIKIAVNNNFQIGCFRYKFNSTKAILKINAYCTRFDRLMCRGGDQSLFISRKLYHELKGYDENFKVMEDYDIIIRARKTEPFKIIPNYMTVSARKYDYNSYLKVNLANLIVFIMFYIGYNQDKMIAFYKWMLNHEKNELKY